jgi:peptidoglycan/LPS O-acetylase OafA/YrhL
MRRTHRAIDLLRTGGILYIVAFWHILGYIPGIDGYKNLVTYRITISVLGLFTLMAGVLAGRKQIRGARQIRLYYQRRFLRILPPYWIALLLFHLVGLLDWPNTLAGMLLKSNFDGSPLPTLWYVNMLVIFYATTPLLQGLKRLTPSGPIRQHSGTTILVISGLTVLAIALVLLNRGMDQRLAIYLPAFATGVLLSPQLLGADDGAETAPPPPGLGKLIVLSAIALVCTFGIQGPDLEHSLWSIPLATVVPLAILTISLRLPQTGSIPVWLEATSFASYFMYLLHRPVLRVLKPLVVELSPGHPWPQLVLLAGLGIPLLVVLSWWLQRLYNQATTSLERLMGPLAARS